MVACLTPDLLVAFHTGYEPRETDRADVSALCERFGLHIPTVYKERPWWKEGS